MEKAFGLPLHPLVVHAAVVLVPLAALMAIVIAVDPERRRRFGVLTWLLAATGAAAAFVAKVSGDKLSQSMYGTSVPSKLTDHQAAGGIAPWFALALLGAVTAQLLLDLDKSQRRGTGNPLLPTLLSVVVLLVAIVATLQVLWTGWTGLEAHWSGAVTV